MLAVAPKPGRSRTLLLTFVAIAVLAAVIVGAFTLRHYKETGELQLQFPNGDSMVRIKERLLPDDDAAPTRLIYLHRGAIELAGGVDNAPENLSSIVAHGDVDTVVMPGFTGSNKQWKSIVTCTQKMFSPFDVTVTDALPMGDEYILVAVGGKASALKQKKHGHASGLAPFAPRQMIPNAVVFAFSSAVRNNPRTVCETIGMEVGHAYGLDHGYHCKDVMTYLGRCGSRTFIDKDVACGERKARVCAGGNQAQNSRKYLLNLLGPSLAAGQKP